MQWWFTFDDDYYEGWSKSYTSSLASIYNKKVTKEEVELFDQPLYNNLYYKEEV